MRLPPPPFWQETRPQVHILPNTRLPANRILLTHLSCSQNASSARIRAPFIAEALKLPTPLLLPLLRHLSWFEGESAMEIYSAQDAAEYLGVSVSALDRHLYTVGSLVPDGRVSSPCFSAGCGGPRRPIQVGVAPRLRMR